MCPVVHLYLSASGSPVVMFSDHWRGRNEACGVVAEDWLGMKGTVQLRPPIVMLTGIGWCSSWVSIYCSVKRREEKMSPRFPSCSAILGVYESHSSFHFYPEGTYRKICICRKRYVMGWTLNSIIHFLAPKQRIHTHILVIFFQHLVPSKN